MEQENNAKIHIILTGGGTAGSVAPLLAIAEDMKINSKQTDFLFVGTANGPEKGMVGKENIDFISISNGKFRRYFSWRIFIDPFFILAGFFKSLIIISKFKPNLVITAGSFVSVPVVWAAFILRVPIR